MALANQIIVVPSSKTDLLGTGLEATGFDWDRVETIELSARSYVYPTSTDSTSDQTLASVQAAQIKSDLIILQGIKSFKIVGVEPQINTADGSGYKTVTGELPYEYEIMFDNNGVNLWKALRKLNSKDSYNCAFYDVEGNKIFTSNKAGTVFKGFQTKMLFTGQYKGKEGNNPAEVKMNIQLADTSEMERQVWISGETLDFDAKSDLDGVNDLYLSNIVTPIANGTSWTVGVTLADRSQFVSGIAATQFFLKRVITATGVTTYSACTITSSDSISKSYVLGVTGANVATGSTYSIVTGSNLGTATATNIIQNSTTKLLYKGIGVAISL